MTNRKSQVISPLAADLGVSGRQVLLRRVAGKLGLGPMQRAVLKARLAEFRRGHKLPSGDFEPFHPRECRNRRLPMEIFAQIGPITRTVDFGRIFIFIEGLERARRLMSEHANALRPVTVDIERLVPNGFLRSMEGDVHKHYRHALVTSLAATRAFENAEPVLDFLESQFNAMASGMEAGKVPAAELLRTLNRIASSALIDLVFGLRPGQAVHQEMLDVYRRLGPERVIFEVGPTQETCFAELRTILDRLVANDLLGKSVAGHALSNGQLDETLAGNLIYMVEGGRHDITALLRWVLRDLAYDTGSQERLAQEDASGDPARPLAVAFVKESLRRNQIERLTRLAKQDIVFENWLIPKGAFIRFCLWEAHKDPTTFDRPFDHCPGRFLEWNPGRNAFAPFGIDKHNCPFENATLRFCSLAVGAILRNRRLDPVDDGPAVRNYYQWAPPPAFTLALSLKGA